MLKIFNSLTRKKEIFKPIEPGKVGMYVCGMTVYDYCHLGHARAMVVFDIVARYLRDSGYEVNYVRNVTDIDDKIINRAAENGEDFIGLTNRFIEAMHEDAEALNILPPDAEPRATQSMDGILAMIQTLIEKGNAYAADNGDVYYDVSGFENYGQLSGKKTEDLRAGARVDIDEAKNDPLDFALWKSVKPGEPAWDSPWGKGRPGWHIECSVMSTHCLGHTFDIHGGGQDLQFPHHENEIAQSEAATGEKFVNVWMHNGFVRIDEEKMSKSLGNFFTIREILKKYRAEEVRYFILTSQYRSPLNYSDDQLKQARGALARLYTALRGLPQTEAGNSAEKYSQNFRAAMDDDFNTPEALAVLFEMAREVNRTRESNPAAAVALASAMRSLGSVIGLLQGDPEDYFKAEVGSDTNSLSDEAIETLLAERTQARADRDWAGADRIRDQLQTGGVVIEDSATGTSWRRE